MLGAGIQIIIHETDIEKASELIEDTCPNCGSDQIGLGIGKHKGMKIFNMLIAILLIIPIGNLKPKYYCRSCKEEIY